MHDFDLEAATERSVAVVDHGDASDLVTGRQQDPHPRLRCLLGPVPSDSCGLVHGRWRASEVRQRSSRVAERRQVAACWFVGTRSGPWDSSLSAASWHGSDVFSPADRSSRMPCAAGSTPTRPAAPGPPGPEFCAHDGHAPIGSPLLECLPELSSRFGCGSLSLDSVQFSLILRRGSFARRDLFASQQIRFETPGPVHSQPLNAIPARLLLCPLGEVSVSRSEEREGRDGHAGAAR